MERSILLCVLLLIHILLCLTGYHCADFSVEYNGTVYLYGPRNYTYNLRGNNSTVAVRVRISATNVNKAYPLIVVFKQQANVLSFPLPLLINDRFMYNSVSRTLCPSFMAVDTKDDNTEQILVELSSSMPDESHAPFFHLRLDVLHKFELSLYQKVELSVTPSEPQYYLFNFPQDVDSVMVRVHSRDSLCMTVSVQSARCPVADILDTVKYSGVYQTVTTLGAMTINKIGQNITKFLVVLVLKPEDYDCGGPATLAKPGNLTLPRIKNITLTVTPSLAGYHYYLPIFGAIGIYFMFYIAAAVIILICRSYDKHVRFYLSTFSVLGHHGDRRNPINMSPPRFSAVFDNQIMATATGYTHLPNEDAITRDRRAIAANTASANGAGSSSTLTSTTASVSYQRLPPPQLSHSLFSSSSSSDVEARSDSIQLQAAPSTFSARRQKKVRRLPHLSVPTAQLHGESRSKKSHRRSVSYGSTREMLLRGVNTALLPTSGQVAQCSTCLKLNLVTEGVTEGSNNDGTRGGPGSSARPLPRVTQVEEVLEESSVLQMSEEAEEEPRNERHFYLQSRILFVSDLARKRYSTLDRKYLLYFWYLIIISIFYGLPVVQLVMTYQRALHDTGNEDICYYNFECAHPLGVFTAFNNIISNIGYVMLGLLFLGLTARRDLMHRRTKKFGMYYSQDPYALTAYGIPQHYGLFYAMGLALTMEGLLSACYHICPNFSNFQFDTAYMYILALILMLKIYQTRHPDINASAHSAYMVMAFIILVGVTGVLYGGETFWVIFTIVFLTMSIWLTVEIYYMGQWNFGIFLPRRLYHLVRSDGIHCLSPMYLERMLLLLVANCVNIGIASFGLFTRPRNFASFLLSIFMINLLMYYCFYIIMKCRYRERFHCTPLLYIFLSCVTWGLALYFFIQYSTTWQVTPAQSRALNQPCIFLGFYDVHDVWHFLSSISMFFSFMSIMTLDDDLINTPRNSIPVF